MYKERNNLSLSRNHCCQSNAIVRSLFIVVDLHADANYINLLSVATKKHCCRATKYFALPSTM